jgi:hypothetical protein
MKHHHREDLPADLQGIARRLQEQRPEISGLELDEIKLRAKAAAFAPRLTGGSMRGRLIAGLVSVGLLVGGTGGVIASSGGASSNGNSSANSQYCPPSSPAAGKPKNPPPGNACGQPNKGKH